MDKQNKKRNTKLIAGVTIAAILLVAGGSAYYIHQNNEAKAQAAYVKKVNNQVLDVKSSFKGFDKLSATDKVDKIVMLKDLRGKAQSDKKDKKVIKAYTSEITKLQADLKDANAKTFTANTIDLKKITKDREATITKYKNNLVSLQTTLTSQDGIVYTRKEMKKFNTQVGKWIKTYQDELAKLAKERQENAKQQAAQAAQNAANQAAQNNASSSVGYSNGSTGSNYSSSSSSTGSYNGGSSSYNSGSSSSGSSYGSNNSDGGSSSNGGFTWGGGHFESNGNGGYYNVEDGGGWTPIG